MAPPYLIQPTPSPYAMQSTLQSRNHLLPRLNSPPTTMFFYSPKTIHLPPLFSKTTAQLLRKPSESPYPLPLASEKMKSGTRSFSTASPPLPHSILFSRDSVAVTTTAKEKTTPNFSPSPHLIGQQPNLNASPPHFKDFSSTNCPLLFVSQHLSSTEFSIHPL